MSIKINGIECEYVAGQTILDAARNHGFEIPTLCHLNLEDMNFENKPVSCRVCMVEANNMVVPSCGTMVADKMDIKIDSKEAIIARRNNVELLLSNHPNDCLYCERSTNCDLQTLASSLNIRHQKYEGRRTSLGKDESSLSIVKDLDKCILCRRCENICREVQHVDVYSAINRGFETVIAPAFNLPLHETNCTFCGQCVSVCPTAALTEKNNVDDVFRALHNPEKIVVVQTAPAVRVAISEEFGSAPGTISTGKMVTSLKRLGFDFVFDTNFGADLTIIEEANEIQQRLLNGGRLPILTSCCPAWVNFIEEKFPDLLDVPSTCKSPHEMFGSIVKSYFAEKNNIDPSNIVVVSVMPCVAKKYESARPELKNNGHSDVDYVLTTREFGKMVKEAGINYLDLGDTDFDNPLGESSGAGAIFGSAGGVLEAALRTVAANLGDKTPETMDFKEIRGVKGVKEATINIAGKELKIAAASGLGYADELLQRVQNGTNQYDIIEIMACPGGCIAGGGQPYHHGDRSIIEKRMAAIYEIDINSKDRRSCENPSIIKLYDEFLIEPGSHIAHELLHTEIGK